MGQQQLLLIVLGVIIVGIAVVVGIQVFSASATSANRDAVISDLTNLASLAQQHYRKPEALGGGGNDFGGWHIPLNLQTTANGTYTPTTTFGDGVTSITLTGTGTEVGEDGATPVEVTMVVDSTGINTTTIVN